MNPYKLAFPWSVLCSVYRYRCRAGESRQRSHIPPSRRCLVLVRSRRETLVPSVWSSACTSRAGREPGAPERLQTKPLTPPYPTLSPLSCSAGGCHVLPHTCCVPLARWPPCKGWGEPWLGCCQDFPPQKRSKSRGNSVLQRHPTEQPRLGCLSAVLRETPGLQQLRVSTLWPKPCCSPPDFLYLLFEGNTGLVFGFPAACRTVFHSHV